jgi:membrane protease YdiL (CAAX protease family)
VSAPVIALAVGGPVAVAIAWTLVRSGRVSVWVAMSACLGALGFLALATGQVRAGNSPPALVATALGVGAGVALYLATSVFVSVARRWRALARHATALYRLRGHLPLAGAVLLAAGVSAVGEELLWRGVVQTISTDTLGKLAGPAVAWGVYVAANSFSRSVPIILGAVVGGAVWTALAVWTGGIAASVACHVVWTALMTALPPMSTEGMA